MEHDINNLKIEVAVINEKLDSQSKKLDEVLDVLKNHIHDINDRYDELNNIKADKAEVERIGANQSKIMWIVIIAVVAAVLKLVLIQ